MWEFPLCVVTLGILSVASEEQELDRPSRIVGGVPVEEGQFPWQVSLQQVVYRGTEQTEAHFCGGALVAEGWVLTAAHCTTRIPYTAMVVKTGMWKLSEGGSKYRVSNMFRYNYVRARMKNDIALLKLDLENPIFVGNGTSSIIPLEEEKEVKAKDCLVSGWGTQSFKGRISDVLKAGKVSIKEDKECSKALREVNDRGIYRTNICAGGEDVDACQGDSGGPLVCCEDPSNPIASSCALVGVTSWGVGCATEGIPGVYTEVAYYAILIKKQIEREEQKMRELQN